MKVRTSSGDGDDAFRSFAIAEGARLVRFALVVASGDEAQAADLAQTALMRVYEHWDAIQDSPIAYARRVVLNERVSAYRKLRRWKQTAVEVSSTDSVPDGSSSVDDSDAIRRAMRTLSDVERKVVALRFLADLSVAETAIELSIPQGTVKSATARAISKLRQDPNLNPLEVGLE